MARPSRWSPDAQKKALAIYAEDGLAAASLATGIPKQTISRWGLRDGVGQTHNEKATAALQARRLSRDERAAQLADALLSDAEKLRAMVWEPITVYLKSGAAIDLPRPNADVQKTLLLATAIAIDKSQLLAGKATSRPENLDELRRLLEQEIPDPEKRKRLALRVLSSGTG